MIRLRLRSGVAPLGAVVAATLLLASCFTYNVSKDYQFKPGATKGLVFASVTVSGERPSLLFLKFRKVGTKGDVEMQQIPVVSSAITMPMDWEAGGRLFIPDNDPAGRLMGIELPPGKYEFYAWHGQIPGYRIFSTKPFAYQFEVTAGRATYVGNMHFRFEDQRRYRMGMLPNTQERDVALLRKKVPKVREDEIDVKLMEVGPAPAAAQK